jgi:hypothetical protein
MAVGGVGRGGRGGGPKGPGAAKGSGATFKVTGNEAAGKAESLVGASRAAGTGEVAAAAGADPITASLNHIAKELASGALASKSEATKKAVETILQKKGLLGKGGKGSKKVIEQIADTLESDPRLSAALERTWTRAGNK